MIIILSAFVLCMQLLRDFLDFLKYFLPIFVLFSGLVFGFIAVFTGGMNNGGLQGIVTQFLSFFDTKYLILWGPFAFIALIFALILLEFKSLKPNNRSVFRHILPRVNQTYILFSAVVAICLVALYIVPNMSDPRYSLIFFWIKSMFSTGSEAFADALFYLLFFGFCILAAPILSLKSIIKKEPLGLFGKWLAVAGAFALVFVISVEAIVAVGRESVNALNFVSAIFLVQNLLSVAIIAVILFGMAKGPEFGMDLHYFEAYFSNELQKGKIVLLLCLIAFALFMFQYFLGVNGFVNALQTIGITSLLSGALEKNGPAKG